MRIEITMVSGRVYLSRKYPLWHSAEHWQDAIERIGSVQSFTVDVRLVKGVKEGYHTRTFNPINIESLTILNDHQEHIS